MAATKQALPIDWRAQSDNQGCFEPKIRSIQASSLHIGLQCMLNLLKHSSKRIWSTRFRFWMRPLHADTIVSLDSGAVSFY